MLSFNYFHSGKFNVSANLTRLQLILNSSSLIFHFDVILFPFPDSIKTKSFHPPVAPGLWIYHHSQGGFGIGDISFSANFTLRLCDFFSILSAPRCSNSRVNSTFSFFHLQCISSRDRHPLRPRSQGFTSRVTPQPEIHCTTQ